MRSTFDRLSLPRSRWFLTSVYATVEKYSYAQKMTEWVSRRKAAREDLCHHLKGWSRNCNRIFICFSFLFPVAFCAAVKRMPLSDSYLNCVHVVESLLCHFKNSTTRNKSCLPRWVDFTAPLCFLLPLSKNIKPQKSHLSVKINVNRKTWDSRSLGLIVSLTTVSQQPLLLNAFL